MASLNTPAPDSVSAVAANPPITSASMSFTWFPAIDTLRGFAALTVLVYHVIEITNWSEFPISGPLVWFRMGWAGVDLFFVISGFVVTYSAARIYLSSLSFRRTFFVHRLSRIVPLYLLTCIVFIVFLDPTAVEREGWWFNLFTHLTFTHNLYSATHGAIDGPNWSVALEMHFYLLVGLSLPWLLRARPWLIAVVFVGIAWGWRLAVFHFVSCDPALTDPLQQCAFQRFLWTTKLPGTLDGFAVGILIARILLSPRASTILFTKKTLAVVAIACIALGTLSLGIYWNRAEYWSYLGMVVFYKTLMCIVFGLLVILACGTSRCLATGALGTTNYFGTISYGIYLWHLIVLSLLIRYTEFSKLYILFYTTLATIALSALSWHLFERPFLRLGGAKRDAGTSPALRQHFAGAEPQPDVDGGPGRRIEGGGGGVTAVTAKP